MSNSQNIYINGRFLCQNLSGVQRFAIEVVKKIKELHPEVQVLCPKHPTNKHLAELLDAKEIGRFSGHLWEQVDLPKYTNSKNGVLVNLCNTGPIFAKHNIITLHDLAVWDFPKSYSWKFRSFYKIMQPLLANKANHIFTVSEFSKSRIKAILGIPENRISVIQNAVSDIFYMEKVHLDPPPAKENYILAVSSLDPKKNFRNLILAYNSLSTKKYKLKIIGAKSNIFKTEKLSQALQNPDIIFAGHVDDKQLAQLYSNATVFVYPSLYEGFGIPPLEAMASGCPVLVSDIPALKETCANAALYCSPDDYQDIKAKLELLLTSTSTCTELINKGYHHVKKFSWQNSAEAIIERSIAVGKM